jgi:hypothetical protein
MYLSFLDQEAAEVLISFICFFFVHQLRQTRSGTNTSLQMRALGLLSITKSKNLILIRRIEASLSYLF